MRTSRRFEKGHSTPPPRILHRLGREVFFDIEHLVEVEQVVDRIDGGQLAACGQRRIAARRAPEEQLVGDVGGDGADIRRRQAYAARVTLWRTDSAPSSKKALYSVRNAKKATSSSSIRSMIPGTAGVPSTWQCFTMSITSL